MAVDYNGIKLLLWAKNLGVSFARTLTLGHQSLCFSPRQFRSALRKFGIPATDQQIERCFHREPMGPLYIDELLRFLGADEVVSLDYSNFEGATFLHDLNGPLPVAHQVRYDFVFDGGTLEHVFDFPSALRHSLEALRVGGHFLSIAPASNLMGHGFYQMSPELYFRVFSDDNGFDLRRMVLFDASRGDADFFLVHDPAQTGRRNDLIGARPVVLAPLAKRITIRRIFERMPQQSDYALGWESRAGQANAASASVGFVGRLRSRMNLFWPYWLRHLKQKCLYYREHRRPTLKNRKHYRRLSADELYGDRVG
jgi:hypothetical protein